MNNNDNIRDSNNKQIIELIRAIRKDLQGSREDMTNLSKIEIPNMDSVLSFKIGNTLGYIELLTYFVEGNTLDIISLADAVKKLPNREEFEETKSMALKIQQKAEKSLTAIENATKELQETRKRGEKIYG
ncbi:MAG: hypothetical protein H0X03_01945 [Nitrosopumilus sp.]|nr:hypothetical protein [Nitrosopumilus sp.]